MSARRLAWPVLFVLLAFTLAAALADYTWTERTQLWPLRLSAIAVGWALGFVPLR